MLMFVYRLDAEPAFELLKERSRATRVAVRLLAAQFVEDVRRLTAEERDDLQRSCADLLFTGHQRIAPAPDDS